MYSNSNIIKKQTFTSIFLSNLLGIRTAIECDRLIIQYCDSNTGLFCIASCKFIALPTIVALKSDSEE
jgi:hypothetical protein